MILFCYFALRLTPRPTPDGCATCDRDSNERGVIWNALYRESPEATASSCDQGLDSILTRALECPISLPCLQRLAPSAAEASNAPTSVSLSRWKCRTSQWSPTFLTKR